MLFCCGCYRYSHCSTCQPLGTNFPPEGLMSFSKSFSLTVYHMITNKSKYIPNEYKSVGLSRSQIQRDGFFSASKLRQVVPSLQLTLYQPQHLDFHHTDITCSFIASTTNTLFFSTLSDTLFSRERTVTKAHGLVGHVFPISFLPPVLPATRLPKSILKVYCFKQR